ncbi:MAG: DNA mismatch repair endonuclease MutL, partial [Carboxydocellales bacterium]
FLRVIDNGCGMLAEDAVLAFERHATSKISVLEDLYGIKSLGFRGEALPSIASVARVELTTRVAEQLAGTKVFLEGGQLCGVEDTGAPLGTCILVRDLFFNTPARRKHLRTAGTEAGLVGEVVSRLALAYPGIAFSFIQNGRLVLKTNGTGNLLDAVVSIQGVQTAKALLPIKASAELFALEGYLGKPDLARANRGNQILFVNGRYVKSKLISLAIEEGYHTYLPIGRLPIFILNLMVNPHLVDVNVHPTKMEVRFSEESELSQFIVEQVKQVLAGQALIPGLSKLPVSAESNLEYISRHNPQQILYSPVQIIEKVAEKSAENVKTAVEYVFESTSEPAAEQTIFKVSDSALEKEEIPNNELNFFAELQILGQLDATYIVATGSQGLFIIDQHAAHERVRYEKLLNTAPGQALAQNLIMPVSIELGHLEAEIVITNILLFRDLGYILEHFGGNAFLIRTVPQGLPPNEETQLFFDILDNLKSKNNYQVDKLGNREELLIMHACKSAIKANQPLNKSAIEELLKQLGETANPYTCPHGRPTMIQYTGNDLAKAFKRI